MSVPAYQAEEAYYLDLSTELIEDGYTVHVIVHTNIPNFDINTVTWYVQGGPVTYNYRPTEDGLIVYVIELPGGNFDVMAQYSYNGQTYSQSVSVTI